MRTLPVYVIKCKKLKRVIRKDKCVILTFFEKKKREDEKESLLKIYQNICMKFKCHEIVIEKHNTYLSSFN